jgi:[ribosomal protein S5]-alanine N-acetyltransferase
MCLGMREYFLTSERLGFSVWRSDDLALAMALWGDPEVSRFLTASGRMTDDEVRERLGREIRNGKANGFQYWPIFLRESGEFVGCCGLRPHGNDIRELEMGVHLVRAQWRKGIATEACQTVIRYAFDHLNVSSLFAGHNPNNTASARMIRNLGFGYVGDEYYACTGLMHPSYRLVKKY